MSAAARRRDTVPVGDDELSAGLARLLGTALRLLRDVGGRDAASQLAAEAWVLARRADHPGGMARFNGLLHYLNHPPEPHQLLEQGAHMPDHDSVLDVRQEIPARRHELIFRTFGDLAPGDAFVLVNDHDPKPLYYQLAAEHTNEFEWDYLEQGPQVWRVRIGRAAA